MKTQQLIMIGLCLMLTWQTFAQETSEGFTYGEFKTGYGLNTFGDGLSQRFEEGNFSNSGGGLSSIAAFRKFKKVDHFHFGIKFKGLGAAPATGDNNEEMFFNFWGTSIAMKYFPFDRKADKGVFLQGEYNFITQFTQKYRNTSSLDFDHQFAIGSSLAAGVGYQYPLKNRYGLVISAEYDWASRVGEVQGVGDQEFRSTNLAVQVGLLF